MTHEEGRSEFAEKLTHFRSEHGLQECWRNTWLLRMDPDATSDCAAVWIDFDPHYWANYTNRATFMRDIACTNMRERLFGHSDALYSLGRRELFSLNAGFGALAAAKNRARPN